MIQIDNYSDQYYMSHALDQARISLCHDEVPIGAIVVDQNGEIIGRGHNFVEHEHQQLAHAEIRAISQACQVRQDWRLNNCRIYVTLEPCAMCFNLILLSRIDRLIFGAASPIFGYTLDNEAPIQVYRRNILEVTAGVCAQESSELLKNFFKNKRNSSD